jgi:hypothetical protein
MRPIYVIAPSALLGYGCLRWIDGLNGKHHDGPAWTVGHVAFFLSIVLFAVIAVRLRGVAAGTTRRVVANVAAAATLFGAACFLWVITGDLVAAFRQRWPLPGPLEATGPALFGIGLVVLLSLLVAAGRAPVWSPLLFFAGFAAISVNLDLLPLGALLVLGAMMPLARPDRPVALVC